MIKLFVYGTLVFPELLHALTGKNFKIKDAILEGYHRHQIYDGDIARAYPAITESKDSFVKGKLIMDLDEESLKILDFFEGKNYKRKVIDIFFNNNTLPAFVFVWNEKVKGKLKNDWNPDEFKQNYLSMYVNHKIPKVLKDYKPIKF